LVVALWRAYLAVPHSSGRAGMSVFRGFSCCGE
jgi:hypothetical protein